MADPMLFQKTLQDLIKGIRSHRKDPSAFVSKAIAEIKDELRSNDPFLKAEAVSSKISHSFRFLNIHIFPTRL